jgi:hypothetical protein
MTVTARHSSRYLLSALIKQEDERAAFIAPRYVAFRDKQVSELFLSRTALDGARADKARKRKSNLLNTVDAALAPN